MFDLNELTNCIISLVQNPEDSEEIAKDLGKLVFEHDSYPYEHTEELKKVFEDYGIVQKS